MVQRLHRRGKNTKSELRLVVNNVRRQDLVAIVNVILVFLGSPCQTKGFRFCFGPVLALFLGTLEVSGAAFWESWASILAPLGVPWPPFWELLGVS